MCHTRRELQCWLVRLMMLLSLSFIVDVDGTTLYLTHFDLFNIILFENEACIQFVVGYMEWIMFVHGQEEWVVLLTMKE